MAFQDVGVAAAACQAADITEQADFWAGALPGAGAPGRRAHEACYRARAMRHDAAEGVSSSKDFSISMRWRSFLSRCWATARHMDNATRS